MTWTKTRLKHLAEIPIVNGLGEAATLEDETWPRYIRTTDFTGPRELRASTLATLPPDVAARAPVRPGDLLMSAAGTVGKTYLHLSNEPACFAGYLVRFRPKPDVDPRFIAYWTETPLFLDQVEVGKVTSTIDNFSAGKYQNLRLRVPQPQQQRAIADFLDTETARIDALITKKRRMIDLLHERHRALVDYLTRSDRYVPLRRVTDLLPGFMFGSDEFDSQFDGDRLLRGVNVGLGTLRWDDEVRLRPGAYAPERYRLRRHDVVLGMDRPFISGGTRVAMVDEESAGALLVQRVCRIRASSHALAIVVANLLGSRRFVAHVEPDLTGVSVPHLSDSQIGSFPIPLFRQSEIEAIAARLLRAWALLSKSTGCLAAQADLLQEHRQAVITAAVTGELEVPGVAA